MGRFVDIARATFPDEYKGKSDDEVLRSMYADSGNAGGMSLREFAISVGEAAPRGAGEQLLGLAQSFGQGASAGFGDELAGAFAPVLQPVLAAGGLALDVAGGDDLDAAYAKYKTALDGDLFADTQGVARNELAIAREDSPILSRAAELGGAAAGAVAGGAGLRMAAGGTAAAAPAVATGPLASLARLSQAPGLGARTAMAAGEGALYGAGASNGETLGERGMGALQGAMVGAVAPGTMSALGAVPRLAAGAAQHLPFMGAARLYGAMTGKTGSEWFKLMQGARGAQALTKSVAHALGDSPVSASYARSVMRQRGAAAAAEELQALAKNPPKTAAEAARRLDEIGIPPEFRPPEFRAAIPEAPPSGAAGPIRPSAIEVVPMRPKGTHLVDFPAPARGPRPGVPPAVTMYPQTKGPIQPSFIQPTPPVVQLRGPAVEMPPGTVVGTPRRGAIGADVPLAGLEGYAGRRAAARGPAPALGGPGPAPGTAPGAPMTGVEIDQLFGRPGAADRAAIAAAEGQRMGTFGPAALTPQPAGGLARAHALSKVAADIDAQAAEYAARQGAAAPAAKPSWSGLVKEAEMPLPEGVTVTANGSYRGPDGLFISPKKVRAAQRDLRVINAQARDAEFKLRSEELGARKADADVAAASRASARSEAQQKAADVTAKKVERAERAAEKTENKILKAMRQIEAEGRTPTPEEVAAVTGLSVNTVRVSKAINAIRKIGEHPTLEAVAKVAGIGLEAAARAARSVGISELLRPRPEGGTDPRPTPQPPAAGISRSQVQARAPRARRRSGRVLRAEDVTRGEDGLPDFVNPVNGTDRPAELARKVLNPLGVAPDATLSGLRQSRARVNERGLTLLSSAQRRGDIGVDAARELRAAVEAAEEETGVPAGLLLSLAARESSFNGRAVSRTGAKGYWQFTGRTAKRYNLDDPFDPRKAAVAAARLMKDNAAHFGGQVGPAIMAHNTGAGHVRAALRLLEEAR